MNASVDSCLRAGDLDQAIAAANAQVRQKPTDSNARGLLAELLCIAGNLERADAILDSINAVDPGAAVGVALFRQLVRAEQARQQFYAEGRLPEFVKRPEGAMELELRAAVAAREGSNSEVAALLAEAESIRRPASGVSDGAAFDDFRDLDDMSAAHIEALTPTGKYYWIPVELVQTLEFRPPQRRRELLWRAATISVADGPEGQIFIPAIYAARGNAVEPRHKLGYATDFAGAENGPVTGIGLRTFLVGDDSHTILELRSLEFKPPSAAGAAA